MLSEFQIVGCVSQRIALAVVIEFLEEAVIGNIARILDLQNLKLKAEETFRTLNEQKAAAKTAIHGTASGFTETKTHGTPKAM